MKIIVLGGTGYLGSRFVRKLSEENDLYCIVRKSSDTSRIEKCRVRLVYADDIGRLPPADIFVNFSCNYAKKPGCEENVIESNLCTPLKVFQTCLNNGLGKTVTIGTGLPDSFNIYSFTKSLFAEYGKWVCEHEVGHTFFNVRLENYYGPGEPSDRFLPYVVRKLYNNETIELTEGIQKRDLIHIDDVVSNLMHIVFKTDVRGFHDVPLGTGADPTIREVVEYLKEITESDSELMFGAVPMRAGEPDSKADQALMSRYGLKTEIDWKDGMKREFGKRASEGFQ